MIPLSLVDNKLQKQCPPKIKTETTVKGLQIWLLPLEVKETINKHKHNTMTAFCLCFPHPSLLAFTLL